MLLSVSVILLQELQEKLSRLDEDAVVTKAMRSHVTQFPELEKQNKKLKEEIQSYRQMIALGSNRTNL